MEPLTPNTSAFLSYLSQLDNGEPVVKAEPTSLPPSAFFSVSAEPGGLVPDISPDSGRQTSSSSPEKELVAVDGMQAEGSGRRDSGAHHDPAGLHKRKAGHHHTVIQSSDGEDDSEDDGHSGHEDKRAHGNKGSGRGGRKSVGGEDTPGKGSKDSKAARRKEQNRAAQKAFRERREAKVKTLEDKVAELEQKSQGVSAENENLRGLLKRLQEENVALKQSAFTFTMPVGGSTSAGTGTGTSTPRNASGTYGSRPGAKPPTPPHSMSDDPLKSIDDMQPPHLQHRGSSGMSAQVDTPESLNSINSRSNSVSRSGSEQPKQPPMFDPAETFNAFALGVRPEWERQNQINRQASGSSVQSGSTGSQQPPASANPNPTNFADAMSLLAGANPGLSPLSSSGSNNKSEIEALWASFYPKGVQSTPNQPGAQLPHAKPAEQLAFSSNGAETNPYNLFLAGQTNNSTGFTPFINAANNINPMDRMAFRDSSAASAAAAEPIAAAPLAGASATSPSGFDWSAYNADGVDSFLASLSGADATADANDGMNDDDSSAQIQALINANSSNATSGAFGLGAQTFSPTNYLNMSPSPLATGSSSSGLSPASNNLSNSASASNYASPDSIASSSASTAATSHHEGGTGSIDALDSAAKLPAGKTVSDIVYVLGPDGKVIKPGDLWMKMGMQHASEVDHLVIDDLCDQMKAKATCKDGSKYLSYEDAETMFKYGKRQCDNGVDPKIALK